MNTVRSALAISIALTALAACTKPPASDASSSDSALSGGARSGRVITAEALKTCDGVTLPEKPATRVMRIYLKPTIEEIFALNSAATKPLYYDNLPESQGEIYGDAHKSGQQHQPGNNTDVSGNIYHSDLGVFSGITGGEIVEYRVLIDTSNAHNIGFYASDPTGN